MSKAPIPALPGLSGGPDNVKGAPEAAATSRRTLADLEADLEGKSVTELLMLYTLIEARLPATSLKNVSLEKTLVLQLLSAQELQRDVLDDEGATPTQKSQVTNTLSGVIEQLSKLQVKLFNSERMKDLEGVLIDTVNDHMTPEQQLAFMAEYRRRLGAPQEHA